ncbi:putative RNA-binding protein 15B [Hypsibius exemplaris]|uniref:RNA-binding protein 15B n=1 Tax=Hypsibius exemplaris TaxID=2072580 RepID=A0A1W0WUR2_HYPEX|nr:putative RNA-binding protein 15B [Hypsibius exemplaris]
MNRRDRGGGGGGIAIQHRRELSPVNHSGGGGGAMHLPEGRGLGGGVWLTLGGLPRDWREMDVFRAMEKRYGKVNHVRRSPASDREALVQFVSDSDAKFVWAARQIELYDRNCAVELATSRADPRRQTSRDDSPPPMRGGAGAYSNPRMGMSAGFSSRDHGNMGGMPRRQMSNERAREGWNDRQSFGGNSGGRNGGNYGNGNGNGNGSSNGQHNNASSSVGGQSGPVLLPEEDDKATRTLFVGNLEYGITESMLRSTFSKYGMVQDIDIKRPMQGSGNAYAFVRFLILDMAYRAKVALQGARIGNYPCKIGYGKTNPTTRVWVGNLKYPGTASDLDESRLFEEFDRFGPIKKIDYVRGEHYGYVTFESVSASMQAVTAMRGSQFKINGDRGVTKIRMRVDYAEADDPYLPRSKDGGGSAVRRRRDDSKGKDSGEKLDRRRRASDSKSPSPVPQREREVLKTSSSKRRRSMDAESEPEERQERQPKRQPRDESVSPPPKAVSVKPSSDTKRKVEAKRRAPSETLSKFREKSEPVWKGSITLKSTAYPVVSHLLRGPIGWLNSVLAQGQELQITRRLRLEEDKLKDVTDKINSQESATMICFDAPNRSGGSGKPLKAFQDYLLDKQAAGVITAPQAVMYIFPVCGFASKIVADDMPTLIMPSKAEDATDEDFGLLMVVTSNQDGGVASAD